MSDGLPPASCPYGSEHLAVSISRATVRTCPARPRSAAFSPILTVVAASGDQGISRDKLLALLWSEGEPDKSRHALTQSLYHIRKALGVERIFLSGADLRSNRGDTSLPISEISNRRFVMDASKTR